MTHRLFVYGTLAPGRPNAHVLADLPGTWEAGQVNGTLLPDGWGAALGYPGIILNEDSPVVDGLLFSSEALADHWSRLDDFEGDGYDRALTSVTLEDGRVESAYIYVLRESSSLDHG